MTDTTSIMMVTYNRLDLTKRMLGIFFRVTTSPYHLIIVDNGSTDGSVDYLKQLQDNVPSQYCQNIKIQFNLKNMGIAAGRNQGLKIADQYSNEWLSTIDNDIEFSKGWLSECIDIIRANPTFAIGINMEGVPYPLQTINGKTFQVKPMGNLGTACTVFHQDLHHKIGFFTTNMGLYAHEDADFFFRARMLDYQMGYLKQMGVHFGEGELDTGEYREFKTKCSVDNLSIFQKNCHLYMSGRKPYFVPYSE